MNLPWKISPVCVALLSAAGCNQDGLPAGSETGALATVLNLRDQSVVHTGFVVGSAEAGAVSVEVSLDGGPYLTATGASAWTFQLPSRGSTWRDGTPHLLAVRARDAAGRPGAGTTLHLRKGVNQDTNGDGYADIAVGDFQGHVYVFHSGGRSESATLATTLTGADPSFGISVALGDVNGDGYADVLAGAHEVNDEAGAVYLFHSAGERGVDDAEDAAASAVLAGGRSDEDFGLAVAAGDVNGDGYADVVVGASSGAYLFHSAGDQGLAGAGDLAADATFASPCSSVAVGDVNGDGYSDVIVGGNNHVYVFSGAASPELVTTLTGIALNGGVSGLGASVAVADVDGDGHGDVVTADGDSHAYVFYSRGGGGVADSDVGHAATTLSGTSASEQFGPALAVGDINGDGYEDVVVGAFGNALQNAYVFHGARGGMVSADDAHSASTLSGTVDHQGFGMSVAVRDTDGDGYADVVVGAENHAYLFRSRGSAGVASATADAAALTLSGISEAYSLAP